MIVAQHYWIYVPLFSWGFLGILLSLARWPLLQIASSHPHLTSTFNSSHIFFTLSMLNIFVWQRMKINIGEGSQQPRASHCCSWMETDALHAIKHLILCKYKAGFSLYQLNMNMPWYNYSNNFFLTLNQNNWCTTVNCFTHGK